jgi:hypothetical protein
MATKADFSADEWQQIRRAPLMAGLAVVAASPSRLFGVVMEMFVITKVLAEGKAQRASNELVKSVVADLETTAREQCARTERKRKMSKEVRSYAIENCRQVVALVDKKVKPEEAQSFKQWLVSVSHKVAQAAKEDGFLAIGDTEVSQRQVSPIEELSAVLKV